jgi:hypothetical protein
MDFSQVNEYLNKLHFADPYLKLESSTKEKIVFEAEELLKDQFSEAKLTVRIVALQVLFMLEGEDEDFSKYKRHGVQSFSTKGVSVSFNGTNISPDVLAILRPSRGSVGRLI